MNRKAVGRRTLWCTVAVALALAFQMTPSAKADEEKPYRIVDGKVDWYTFSGFRRYHADCHVCHGPDGLGSSFAPALLESMKTMSYDDFAEVVVNGRETVSTAEQKKMPSFGENPNVMCFIDDVFAYLRARADGAIGRGRPKKMPKPQEAKERDADCLP